MKRRPAEGSVNMTPMIDVVFQLIIFFVCTIELEKAAIDESIRLAMAPHGPAIEEKNPLEVVIDVERLRIMGEAGEHGVVHFRHRAAQLVMDGRADLELLEIHADHRLPPPSRDCVYAALLTTRLP